MAMKIMNNASSMLALGETKKNQKSLSKQMEKAATGMKITSAGDGASEYSISGKMRVLLRSLGQDQQNVQNGATLLRTAEGGVQNQIELLKEIKAKVLDANNDTNSDEDRAIIQKEISQRYDEIDDISVETSYNGKLVLHGNYVSETVRSWKVLDEPILVPGSDSLSLIPDLYANLDNKTGPFDVFSAYKTTAVDIDSLGLTAGGTNFSGGTAPTSASWTVDLGQADLNGATLPEALNNRAFYINTPTYTYVLTTDPGGSTYEGVDSANEIDISGCDSMSKVAARMATALNGQHGLTVSRDDQVLKFATTGAGANYKAQNYQLSDISKTGYTKAAVTTPEHTVTHTSSTPVYHDVAAVDGTGRIGTPSYLSGGVNAYGQAGNKDYHAAAAASYSVDLSSAAEDTGFTIGSYYYKLVSGSGVTYNSTDNIYEVGKNYNGTLNSSSNVNVAMQSGTLSVTATTAGASGNSISVMDGIAAHSVLTGYNTTTTTETIPATTTPAVTYTSVTGLGAETQGNVQDGTNGEQATYTIDLSGYNTTDKDAAEKFIDNLAGKAIHLTTGANYEFYDGASADIDSQQQLENSSVLNLDSLRRLVAGGETIASAFASLLSGIAATKGNPVSGVTFTSAWSGLNGNNEKISGLEGSLRHYDIDFPTWLASAAPGKSGSDLAAYLDNKGFRVYCATCTDQWFNFAFYNGMDGLEDKPESGVGINDIKSIAIDVSKVTDAKSLANTIYEQGSAELEKLDHNIHLAEDTGNGILRVYDERTVADLASLYGPYYQSHGSKIADGVLDNVVLSERNVEVERLYIQHTAKSNCNIKVDIPKTSLDHIFAFIPEPDSLAQYTVTTRVSREKLLGKPPADGVLDKGIKYLTDANSLLGAQINHMEYAERNITTQVENVTAAESTIRDADMASEMMGYAKANLLSQSAQAMLAQANQSADSVLGLLQH